MEKLSDITDKLNARQRRFCINLANGMSQSDAWVNAGYSANPTIGTPSDCAGRLLRVNVAVKAYFDYLCKRHEEISLSKSAETVLSATEKRAILANIARAELAEFIDDQGKPVLKRGKAAKALKEFYLKERTDRNGNPVRTSSIKLIDPIEAIREDNKMAGHYAPSKHMVAQKIIVEMAPKLRRGDSAD